MNIKFTARTTKLLGLRCLEKDQKLNSVMGRTNLRSHLSCMQISNRYLSQFKVQS